MSLVNTCRDAFCVLTGMGGVGQHMLRCVLSGVWSSRAEMHFFICWHEVRFGKQEKRYILYHHCHWMALSTNVEMHLVLSLA